jgi:bifunctional DNA-binding transcriptional regulator/antitoxin component of YhaV-PrlF toxin-antitoxin module
MAIHTSQTGRRIIQQPGLLPPSVAGANPGLGMRPRRMGSGGLEVLGLCDKSDSYKHDSHLMADETVGTSKGTSTIPQAIRREAGIGTGTIIQWKLEPDGRIVVREKAGRLNDAQRHIRARAGLWDGRISGAELLRRTRP